jgi:glutathione synthase/RimK-type ligase-like ATP-grasp enzyme
MQIKTERLGTIELLFSSAQKMGLQPEWIIPDGLFVVSTPSGEHYVNYGRSSMNSHLGVSLTHNKYQTRKVLTRHGLPNIPYTNTASLVEAKAFLVRHGTIIAKPLRGSGSVDIHIIRHVRQLESLNIAGYILERYIPGKEMRYLVLGGEVIAVHESKYGESVSHDRDLQRISYEPADWDSTLVDLSIRIAGIVGLSFAAVDFMIDGQGQHHILEVNSSPGFKWFHSPSAGPPVDVASRFLQVLV